jgi:hypothetical protein
MEGDRFTFLIVAEIKLYLQPKPHHFSGAVAVSVIF